MAAYLETGRVPEIFAQYGGDANNTGSTEGQVAYFTFRIKMLSEHLKTNHKDHSCRRTLLTLVSKRKAMLNYLKRKDIYKFRSLCDELGIRR
jgi:small subunit ribosomal protein S15